MITISNGKLSSFGTFRVRRAVYWREPYDKSHGHGEDFADLKPHYPPATRRSGSQCLHCPLSVKS